MLNQGPERARKLGLSNSMENFLTELVNLASDTSSSTSETTEHFRIPKKRRTPQKALVEGRLIDRIEIKSDDAKLMLKDPYNNEDDYASINIMLSNMHQRSKVIQANFFRPKHGSHTPILKLKPHHGFTDGNSIVDMLINHKKDKQVPSRTQFLPAYAAEKTVSRPLKRIILEKYSKAESAHVKPGC